jgi:hypothetical protein
MSFLERGVRQKDSCTNHNNLPPGFLQQFPEIATEPLSRTSNRTCLTKKFLHYLQIHHEISNISALGIAISEVSHPGYLPSKTVHVQIIREVINIVHNLTTQIYRLKGKQLLAKIVCIFVKK